jgi:co-chaperonin GroES (HSP10)
MGYNFTKVQGTFTPLRDGVLVHEMAFGETKTTGGIIMLSDDGATRGIHPRWAEVITVGKDQEDVSPNQWVLVAHGRWSRGFDLNGATVRTVDPKDILAVSDDRPDDIVQQPSMGHIDGYTPASKPV